MNRRERILLMIVGGFVALFAVAFGVQWVFVKPLRAVDRTNSALRERLGKIQGERRAYFAAEDYVKKIAATTFSDDADRAVAAAGELLSMEISRCGLSETNFARVPVAPRRLRGATELGWSVQGEGPLTKIVNLLYLLQRSPYLHRVENVALLSGDKSGQVKLRFRFLTLSLNPAPVIETTNSVSEVALQSPERTLYDGIIARDLLRPYIKRQEPPAVAATPAPAPNPGAPGPENFKIVSLSEWQGAAEVHVRNLAQQQTTVVKIGEPLAGGAVLAIDYRPLPFPGRAPLLSYSRVLVQIGDEVWAVEQGQTLAEKRRLAGDELPEQLSLHVARREQDKHAISRYSGTSSPDEKQEIEGAVRQEIPTEQ